MTNSEKIRSLLKKGLKPTAIAKRLKIKPGYVYQIRWKDQNGKKKGKSSSGAANTAVLTRAIKHLRKGLALLV